MKKIIILITIVVFISGCNNNSKKIDINLEEKTKSIIEKENYVDDNPIKLGIYDGKTLVKDYETELVSQSDLAVFSVYFTQDEILDSVGSKYNYKKYYQNYDSIDNYKIGFYINFTNDGKFYEANILSPNDMYVFSPFMYIYLYDDVNQEDYTFYSHLTSEDINDDTVYSSIKLYLEQTNIENISITAFTYDGEEDFSSSGYYRGNSKYTVNIKLNK